MRNLKTISILSILLLTGCVNKSGGELSPVEVAQKVADRLVEMTVFETYTDIEHPVQDNNLRIDFTQSIQGVPNVTYYAEFDVVYDKEADKTGLLLGISQTAGTTKIYLNGQSVAILQSDTNQGFSQIDYALFEYGSKIPVPFADGQNTIRIAFTPNNVEAILYFGLLQANNGLRSPSISYLVNDGRHHPVQIAYQRADGEISEWTEPKLNKVTKLRGPLDLAEWRYFNGTYLDALYSIHDTFPALDYTAFIDRHLDFFLGLKDKIKQERSMYGLRESPFGHYYRYNLLDDIGMQAVPYVERLIRERGNDFMEATDYELVGDIADFILTKADRLDNGTWARFTPDTMSVWADDLFMGSIVLNRMSQLTGNPDYIEESVFQTIMFDDLLKDEETGVYWHGYFSRNHENSSSKWGRANGWTMMAKTDLLLRLNPGHEQYNEVLGIYKKHADAIMKLQSTDGRWHQILDNPNTYLETSCTAMFVRVFAEGVIHGWLDKDIYDPVIRKGWSAISKQIDADGTVSGIVRGTPIMFSDEEYHNWATRPHDPRGLGAILFAAATMERYLNQ